MVEMIDREYVVAPAVGDDELVEELRVEGHVDFPDIEDNLNAALFDELRESLDDELFRRVVQIALALDYKTDYARAVDETKIDTAFKLHHAQLRVEELEQEKEELERAKARLEDKNESLHSRLEREQVLGDD